MTKLNQVLAIEKGIKANANRALTDLHRVSEKPDLYEGRVKSYTPSDAEGEQLPPEQQVVQQTSASVLKQLADLLTPLWNVTATKDFTNASKASADVVVDGQTLIKDAPVTYLLFLEKQLNDLETVYSKLPTLDASQRWQYDDNQQVYVSDKATQARTKKVMRNHVRAPATAEHPAQVDVFQEDVTIGRWDVVRQSGAFSIKQKAALLEKVRKLKAAVLFAREKANSVEAVQQEFAATLLGYLTTA